MSEEIALASIFCFGTIFVFCRSINKNVLECFLLITSKEYTLTRSTNLISRNHPRLCFWLIREGRKMPYIISNFMIRSADADIRRYTSVQNFAIFTRKHLRYNPFLIILQASRPAALLKSNFSAVFTVNYAKFLRKPILKNICEWLLLKFNESVFWSWNIIILNLLWKAYFMCILESNCTNTVVIWLKNKIA